MKQIQKITVPTPRITQIIFITFVVIMMIPFFVYIASASPLDHSICDKIYYDTFIGEVYPEFNKMCKNRFQYLTNQIKRSYITNQK